MLEYGRGYAVIRLIVFVVLFAYACAAYALANTARLSTPGMGTHTSATTTYFVGYYTFQKGSCFEILKVVPEGMSPDAEGGTEVHQPVPQSRCVVSKDAQFVMPVYFEERDVCSKLYQEHDQHGKSFVVILPVPEEEKELCSR